MIYPKMGGEKVEKGIKDKDGHQNYLTVE